MKKILIPLAAFIFGIIVSVIFTTYSSSVSRSVTSEKTDQVEASPQPNLPQLNVDSPVGNEKQDLETKDLKIRELERQILQVTKDKEDIKREYTAAANTSGAPPRSSIPQKVVDTGGNVVFEYDNDRQVLKFDSAKSVVMPGEGKVFLNKKDHIANGLKSVSGEEAATLNFTNSSPDDLYLFWIDYNGNPVPYDRIVPGATSVRPTYMSHPWVITDAFGNRIEQIRPELTGQTESIEISK